MPSMELKDTCVAFQLHSVQDLIVKKGKWLAHANTSVRFSTKFDEEAENKIENNLSFCFCRSFSKILSLGKIIYSWYR